MRLSATSYVVLPFIAIVAIFAMFFATSEVLYINILYPIIKTERNRTIAHIIITLIGQSFWLLLLGRIYDFSPLFDIFFYVVFVCFLYMFFGLATVRIIRLFKNIDIRQATIVVGVVAMLFTGYGYVIPYFPSITRYSIKSEKPVKAKIAFMSDTHIGDLGMKPSIMEKAINLIAKEKVDFLVIGGDIVEGSPKNFEKYKNIFANNPTKTYGVLGNHDYYHKNYLHGVDVLEDGNIDILLDEWKKIGNIVLIGREDITNRNRQPVASIMNGVDKNDFLLLVDHNPHFFNDAVEQGVDLQLSGHTHNGQLFPFNLIVKFIYEKPYGLLEKAGSKLITSSGLSSWGPPIKLGSKPEIVIVEIN